MKFFTKYIFILFLYNTIFNTFSGLLYAQQSRVLLPNGWSLSPAGSSLKLGDLPMNIAISEKDNLIAIVNNGLGDQSIMLVDANDHSLLQTMPIAKSWLGLKFTSDGKYLFASGGNDNIIFKYTVKNRQIELTDSIKLGDKWPNKISPTGIEIDNKNNLLYVVTKEDNSLYVIDFTANKIKSTIRLSAEAYTCLLSKNNKQLYISLWGGSKVMVYDTKTEKIIDSINVGRNPNDMCITLNGKFLYVANSIDNTVSVIDLKKLKIIETLNAALFADAPSGSTTNSVTLSKDEKTLYIANADNNCLAVFDVSVPGKSISKGFIPTGWYPTCVRIFNKSILVLNGKGTTSLPNPKGPQPIKKSGQAEYKKGNKKNEEYIGGLFMGSMNFIPIPTEKELINYSKTVYENTPYTKEKETNAQGEPGNPIPMKVGEQSPIKYVFYIIKENRTYDQVLGDEPNGNGDTSLVLFGKKITPNQHEIAEQFVLLDNFYVDAEVSADGHNWSMAGYANDYIEKTWPTNYSRRGGTYDYAANKKIALPKNGFLWDYALRAGVSVRDYGEFTDDDGNVYLPELNNKMCHSYPGWNLNIKDVEREHIWEKDFDSLLAINAVPQLNFVYFPSDHTAGLGKKSRTPYAFVADNDLAVGEFLEHLSHSKIWNDCAVFVLEDDAQNGPDHVDAHRSIAFVAGPYVKRHFTDHTMYSTTGMLRTIELILGLPPMSQYDAGAMPMFRCFTKNSDITPYNKIEETINMDELNTASSKLSDISDKFDFSNPDKVPDDQLSELLWYAIKAKVQYPAPKHAAFVRVFATDDD